MSIKVYGTFTLQLEQSSYILKHSCNTNKTWFEIYWNIFNASLKHKYPPWEFFFDSHIKIFKISWDTLEILLKQTMGKYLIFDKKWKYSTIDYLYWLVIIPNTEHLLTFFITSDDLKQYWTIKDNIW